MSERISGNRIADPGGGILFDGRSTDTSTATRTLVFTREQVSLISQWASNAWHDADRTRFALPVDSPQEAACLADQQFIETIQTELRGF